jgi:hypothetical protein
MNNLAGVLRNQGNYEEAEEMYLYLMGAHLMGVYFGCALGVHLMRAYLIYESSLRAGHGR